MRLAKGQWSARNWKAWGAAVAVAAAGVATAAPAGATTADDQGAFSGVVAQPGWASAGQNNHNTHNSATENIINPANAHSLAPKWAFTTAGDVSATPTVVNGTVYVPDWGGKLWAINAGTGKAVWSNTIESYNGIPGDVSRTSPAYWAGELVIGTGAQTITALDGAYVVGIDAKTGKELWKTEVDNDPAAVVTSSPTIDNGVIYVGTSSKAEAITATPTFRGALLALDARTGKILWKTVTVPQGYTGGAVWGSQPVVDHKTGMVYVGVGNNYSSPPGVCEDPKETNCTPPSADDHIDSVLGLSLATGKIQWSRPTLTADTWTVYEPGQAPDFDFGTDPNLYTAVIDGKPTDLLGIGQKSGVYWALDPATGNVVWQTQAGPGGALGGIEWGTATDGKHIFADIANGDHLPYTVTAADGTKSTTTGGLFVALDAATGKIDWQTADPQAATGNWLDDSFVSSANGVMYAGSSAPTGSNMYALDANTGKVLWSYASGGSVFAGAAIVNGNVFWGTGYHTEKVGLGYTGDNNKLYDFTLNGR
jgi:polyvinyl alcohol dehydrogenase (cytochrome)